jgi:hypothetical protein
MANNLYTPERIDLATMIVKEYAEEAEKITKSVISLNKEAILIISIVEEFLRDKHRIIYGGAAINALMPTELKFYDPKTDLPDYDFLTPDALSDCRQLVERYKEAGFKDVEVNLGVHEGTYKVFVDYRAAADVTEIPRGIYDKLLKKSRIKDGLTCAPPDWLRMSIYLELSRPAGNVSRWEKVFRRLQLLNKVHPLVVKGCDSGSGVDNITRFPPSKRRKLHGIMLQCVADTRTFFAGAMLEGIFKALQNQTEKTEFILGSSLVRYDPKYILTTETLEETTSYLAGELKACFSETDVVIRSFPGIGEILPARNEVFFGGRRIATLFPTVACHAFITMSLHIPYDKTLYLVRVASIDTAISMLYAMWFSGLQNAVGKRILCVLQSLIDIEAHMRLVNPRASKISLLPVTCLGYEPSLPELKKAHRERVKEKKSEVHAYLEKTLTKLLRTNKNSIVA